MDNLSRKIKIALVLVIVLSALLSQSASADPGGDTTPQDLMEHGWVCLYRFNQYAYCMNPTFTGPGPTAIMNKTFQVDDASFSNPVYLGTSIFLSADQYAGQPCPTNSSPDWVLVLEGRYYNCRHFERSYP